ncbi:KLTH0H03454p [Lachancea thermotolerans CBS 6340]|uniref:KLTH0H03454p n=1 Tax=Lachancea thermotolerans (strain ATCC 56472 / CBS 6340 / NRRL Y-8284) TaxID=559295 RepID=C5E2A8_LACTC|nr:KLTH0H03454p [Lachancea thermotolerans CBS 6340]CAR30169.1 KLTH0H03454p [Lachancea thermotolerans CBS 6340]
MSDLFERARQRLSGSSSAVPEKLRDLYMSHGPRDASGGSGSMSRRMTGADDGAGPGSSALSSGGDSSGDDSPGASSSDLASNGSRDLAHSHMVSHARGGSDNAAADAGAETGSGADPAANATN